MHYNYKIDLKIIYSDKRPNSTKMEFCVCTT